MSDPADPPPSLPQADVRSLQARLDAAERSYDVVLSRASHELRTPLNSMLGWLRLVQSGVLDPAQQARALATIERNIRLQVRLIDELLDASRGDAAARAAPVPELTRAVECPPVLKDLRVLVVDDEPDARELLCSILAHCRAEVRAAGSASEALDALDGFSPNVLVSDIAMPDLDGYYLISAIRSRPPDRGGRIPAIALTAYTRVDDRRRCLSSGFQVHVPKPVEPAEILAIVASLAPATSG